MSVLQVRKRRLRELHAFTLPGQSNRLALVFNPLDDIGVPFTFGLEIFERNHQTPPHSHSCAHELFFILSGSGSAFCDGRRFAVHPGDVVVFPPTSGTF
jgi:mannose-6-phosphate isomerase-like protein (cupin superfamily)